MTNEERQDYVRVAQILIHLYVPEADFIDMRDPFNFIKSLDWAWDRDDYEASQLAYSAGLANGLS